MTERKGKSAADLTRKMPKIKRIPSNSVSFFQSPPVLFSLAAYLVGISVNFGPCALVRAHRVPLERFPGTSFNEILKIPWPGSRWTPIRTPRAPSTRNCRKENSLQSAADSGDSKDAPIFSSFLSFLWHTLFFCSATKHC